MAEETILADDLIRQLMSVGEVDLLVGINSPSNAPATVNACRAIEQCFQQRFTRQRAAIVNVCAPDAGGGDGSAPPSETDGRLGCALRTIQRVTAAFPALPSPGQTLRTLLTASDLLRAKACAVLAPGAELTPERVATLLKPVFHDKFDFVAPLYTRHKFQGLLARTLLYPMSRALFCCGVRELYSDEWAFSGRLASACLAQDVWHEESIQARPEAWMAITAIASEFRLCQTFLGPKLPPPAGSATDIVEVFRETVGNLFWCMEAGQSTWINCQGSDLVQTLGQAQELTTEASDLDPQRIREMFRTGVAELGSILSSILDPETHAQITGFVECKGGSCRLRPELWVRSLYEFASSYHHSVINRDHLVQALVPLYRGMTYSYLMEHAESTADEMEAANESLCAEFARQKPYLTERWNAKLEVKL